MSWLERYERNLTITTGDEETFEVFTLPKFSKSVEYHSGEFSFVPKEGELIKRKNIKGRTFPLEFYFVGEDHLEDAASFEFSASHPDPWIINHPYYNNIVVQVTSINFDDTEGNVTKVTCVARETQTDDGFILERGNPIDTVQNQKAGIDALISEEPISEPSTTDINTIQATAEQNYKEGVKIINIPEEAEEYFNAYNTAISAVNTITASPILAMQALTNLLSLPAQFTANVQDRLRVLVNTFNNLRNTILGLTRPVSKVLFQAQGAAIISAMCKASVTPLTRNYSNSQIAQQIAEILKGRYAQFVEDIDTIQSVNGGNPAFFIPSHDVMTALDSIVKLTVSSLKEIALNGRKEFTHILTEDSNAILLTHKFYGLDANDANLVEFINNNNLKYDQIALGIIKGTTVVYYA